MLLTITLNSSTATDLGYLVHKNPNRWQEFPLAFGKAFVFYPEATDQRTTVALLLDIDPVGLIRGQNPSMDQYVNDRPYTAGSFMSVAIAQVFGSALSGKSKEKQDLADAPLNLEATVSVVHARGGEALIRKLFGPLGYEVTVEQAKAPEFTDASYFTLTLKAAKRLSDMLSHIYVLLPVLDAQKHYWIAEDEVEKLLRHGEGWLPDHPERDFIASRYLKFRHLVGSALSQLEVDQDDNDEVQQAKDAQEAELEKPIRLHDQRLGAVMTVLKQTGATRVLDLGCGEGQLVRHLLAEKQIREIVGMDVSHRALEIASERLHLDTMPAKQRERLKLMQGSLTYRDRRLEGYDAAAIVEVIEHLDPPRLHSFERAVFEFARPATVVITTPNAEYNVLFEGFVKGSFRHKDHRFEWTRDEFSSWASGVAAKHGYAVRFLPIGPEDPAHGAPSQMGIFTRVDSNQPNQTDDTHTQAAS